MVRRFTSPLAGCRGAFTEHNNIRSDENSRPVSRSFCSLSPISFFDIYIATQVTNRRGRYRSLQPAAIRQRSRPCTGFTLGLLVVFGGLTLALRDPTFKVKPTVVNWLFAVAFLSHSFS